MAGSPAEKFFHEIQGAAILKHGILRCHLHIFTNKLGSRARFVSYLDGNAGPGAYDDGTPGSPLLAADTARTVAGYEKKKRLVCHYVEKDPDLYEKLVHALQEVPHEHHPYKDDIEDALPKVMQRADDSPLFAFFDPFGLPISFDTLVEHVIKRPRPTRKDYIIRPTEVLLNLSVPALERTIGVALSDAAGAAGARKTLDDRLGGRWWKDTWGDGGLRGVMLIADEYAERLAQANPPWKLVAVPARDRLNGAVAYYLLFLTQHPHGVWHFAESAGSGYKKFREAAQHREPSREREGQLGFSANNFDVEQLEWVAEMSANARTLLEQESRFRPLDHVGALYGRALGLARATHLRHALLELFDEGVLKGKPQGKDWWKEPVERR